MGAEEDSEIEEHGHVGSDASSVLGVHHRRTIDHGDGSRESVQGSEDEDDGESGNVGADVRVVQRNDAKDDEGEEDGLEGSEDPVPLARDENDEFTVLELGDEARKSTANKVTNLESTNEKGAEPSLLESLVLRRDVEKQTGEDGEADEEDPEDVECLGPELSKEGEEGSRALLGVVQQESRVIVVDGGGSGSRSRHLSLVLLNVVANELHARHGQKSNEASENHSSGDGEVSNGRLSGTVDGIRFLETSLGSRLDSEDNDTSNSVTTHDGGHVLGREHSSETKESSNQDGSAETANGGHGQNNTERGLGRNDREGESVLHGDDGEDDNLDSESDQKAAVRSGRTV